MREIGKMDLFEERIEALEVRVGRRNGY